MILQDVLAQREFGLRPLVRGPRSARRAVLGAHPIEAGNPSRWVPPRWIVLTTGLRLWRDVAAQRELVAELAEGGVAALGFGTGIVFDTVPAALLDEARRREFPVFEVPERTPFREIVRMVDAALLGQDLQTFRRSASITDSLVAALGEPDPETTLVARLARALRCETSLHRADGTVLFTSGQPAGAGRRWRRLRELPLAGPPVEVIDADGLFATAVEVDGAITSWLVVEVSRGSLAVPLILRALTVACRLLEGLGAVRDRERAQRRVARAELLRRVLALPDAGHEREADELRDRARALGVGVDEPGRVLAVGFPASDQEPAPPAVEAAERLLARHRLPHLLAVVSGRLAVWLPAGADHGELAGELLAATGGTAAGVGREAAGVHGVRASGADATLALAGSALGSGPPVVWYDQLGLLEWLALAVGPDRVRERAAAVLAPLDGHQFLIDTLREYLRCSLSVPATARALHVHENSVRHRLNRARTLLARDLHAAPTLADLHLALLLSAGAGRSGRS
ncbi:PucR family transcriptional regulator [Pseudonocardia acaciae]|uniref:PucR family transcriptional regulator n=1 Tax=Pseudonocardia acaciae TaxID=551276 RepID=UPI0004909B7F|nr:PucR family transcriptional regulator [Pseudonocardia acaciae]